MKKFKEEKNKLKQIITLIHVHPCYLQNFYLSLGENDSAKEKFFEYLKAIYPNNFIANVNSNKYLDKQKYE